MFQHRSTAFDPRLSAIVDQLRAMERQIEKQLDGIGKNAGSRTAATAASAGSQFAEAIAPILNDVLDRLRRGQRLAADEAVSIGNKAATIGAQAGTDAAQRIATQARNQPLLTLAVAVGVGMLIGLAARRV
jgi:ElaB/YqjD/DUF883 family membrane-anchored ribosome-binding protein